MLNDDQVFERPKCSNPNCSNHALLFVLSKPFCGDCVVKLHQKQQKLLLEEMKHIDD